MYENGWYRLYFNKTSELFSDRFGIRITNDVINPFSNAFPNEAVEKEILHVHPKTNEPYLYDLYEYKFGDYLLRYLKAEIDGEFTAVWRKVEPAKYGKSTETKATPMTKQKPVYPTENEYGVYHSVPGMKEFIESYQNQDFLAIWKEYDAFLKEKYREYYVPLLPGNSELDTVIPFDLGNRAPIADFLTLYFLCNGQSDSKWIEMVEEKEIAYAHLNGYPLMTLEEIIFEVRGAQNQSNVKQTVESIPPQCVKDNFMLVNKIPFYHDGGGNFTAIDLDPDCNGTYGQIVSIDHEYDERIVLASSLKEYILILYYFVKELGVIDNGEGYDGEQPFEKYIHKTGGM